MEGASLQVVDLFEVRDRYGCLVARDQDGWLVAESRRSLWHSRLSSSLCRVRGCSRFRIVFH